MEKNLEMYLKAIHSSSKYSYFTESTAKDIPVSEHIALAALENSC